MLRVIVVSACTDRLEVPYFKLSTIGGRAFPVAASQIWNSLPDRIVYSESFLTTFVTVTVFSLTNKPRYKHRQQQQYLKYHMIHVKQRIK